MKHIITFGEIMLRLKSPGVERLFQSPYLEATFGGGEANVAVSLSLLGAQATFVSVLPTNPLGEGAMGELRRHGVDVSRIRRTKDRMGTYYLETGANQRASNVVYDREGSGISRIKPGDLPWAEIFQGADWFHTTGITPALSQSAADTAIEAVKAARAAGLEVSIDLNFRKKLWQYGVKAPEIMRKLAAHATVLIANEEDIQLGLGMTDSTDVTSGHLSVENYKNLAQKVKEAFPSVHTLAITLRRSHSADRNGWSAVLHGKSGFYESQSYDIDDIVDRVGGGDSFGAGLIFGLLEYPQNEEKALRFAVAASALKHSILGDFNLVTRDEVEALVAGDGSGRVQR
ncbi:MAG: sugar kinase [Spirochaetales bacterium]|nr:sugar kinase [Spirochaetales bacterium]